MRKFEKDLEAFVAERLDITKADANLFVNDFERHIKNCIEAGVKVQWTGLFVMEGYTTKARTGRNPKTGELLEIPAKKSVKAKISSAWKKEINAALDIEVTKTNERCSKQNTMDGSVTAIYTDGFDCTWTDSNGKFIGNTATIQNLSAGTYFVRIENGAGESGVNLVVVEDDNDCDAV